MYVDEGFNERIESERENIWGDEGKFSCILLCFVFGMFCVLNGSGMKIVTFSWGLFISMIV